MPALATLELSRRVIRTLTPRQRWLGLERDAVLEAPMRCHPVDFGSAAPHQRVRTRIVLVAAPWMWSDKTFGASSNDAILVTDLGRIPPAASKSIKKFQVGSAESERDPVRTRCEELNLEYAIDNRPGCRISWYIRCSISVPDPSASTSAPRTWPGGSPSTVTRKPMGCSRSYGPMTRCRSRSWNRNAMRPQHAQDLVFDSNEERLFSQLSLVRTV